MSRTVVTVIGLGKIGLPLALQFCSQDMQVFGYDLNSELIEELQSGKTSNQEENQLQFKLTESILNETFIPTKNLSDSVRNSDVVVFTIPLFVNTEGIPDFSSYDSTIQIVAKSLKDGSLISFETTLPIGTTKNRFTPLLEEYSGLYEGEDFGVVFSPERVMTGRVFDDLRRYPKLVGGVSDRSTQMGVHFYESAITFDERDDLEFPNGVWRLENSESAEFCKIAETTYRDVNIALANEFSLFATKLGIKFNDIVSSCNSQPFSHLHQPGISVGGHCIPVYPRMYSWTDRESKLVPMARQINENMPKMIVEVVLKQIGALNGKNIAILGLTYRPNVKEIYNSGAIQLQQILSKAGANVFIDDCIYENKEIIELGFHPLVNPELIDVLVLHTAHSKYETLREEQFVNLKLVIDGRDGLTRENFASIPFWSLGDGGLVIPQNSNNDVTDF